MGGSETAPTVDPKGVGNPGSEMIRASPNTTSWGDDVNPPVLTSAAISSSVAGGTRRSGGGAGAPHLRFAEDPWHPKRVGPLVTAGKFVPAYHDEEVARRLALRVMTPTAAG
jgi:hypothetical protein